MSMWIRPLPATLASLVLGAALTTPAVDAQAWRELGPAPINASAQFSGRIAALAVSAQGGNRYYAGAASGGVWQTTNGGNTWNVRGDGLPTLAIGALAVDPTDDRVVYAGSGEANVSYHSLYGLGLFKSVDRGRTWEVLASDVFEGRAFSRIAISPFDSRTLYAAVAWAGGNATRLEGARNHPRRRDDTGLFKSTDGGETWRRLSRGARRSPASDVLLHPDDPDLVFLAHGNPYGQKSNGIFRSTDGGERFRKRPLGLPGNQMGRTVLAVAPSDTNRLYALVTNPTTRQVTSGSAPGGGSTKTILVSYDRGDTWQQVPPPVNFQAGQGNYNTAITVDPDDPEVIYVGGVQALRLRITNGQLASSTDITPPHVDLHALVFDARKRLVAATDGGVFRSADQGTTWMTRNGRLGTVQLYAGLSTHPTNATFLIGGMQDNGTNVRTSAKGWTQVFGGDGGYTAVDPTNPNTLFVEFQGTGNLFRSTDGGFTFQQTATGIAVGDRHAFLPPFVFDPTNPQRMLYATNRIYETTCQGCSWQAVSGDLSGGAPWAIRSLVIAPSNPRVVYAGTNDGRVLTSRDNGRTFALGLTGIGGWPRVTRQIAVDPVSAQVAYVADQRFGGQRVYETRNFGSTWTPIGGTLPDVPVNAVAVLRNGSSRIVLAGTDDGVWLTANSGASWSRFGTGLPRAPVQDLVVDRAHSRLVASTLGRGVWSVRLPSVVDTTDPTPASVPLKNGR